MARIEPLRGEGMTRRTWIYVIAAMVLALVILGVAAGFYQCDPPADDDDSAEDIAAELDEVEAEFDNPDADYRPGVL